MNSGHHDFSILSTLNTANIHYQVIVLGITGSTLVFFSTTLLLYKYNDQCIVN